MPSSARSSTREVATCTPLVTPRAANGAPRCAAALFSGVPVYLVAGSAATDLSGAELTKRVDAVNRAATQRGAPFAARGITSGVQVAAPRVELLALDGITLID